MSRYKHYAAYKDSSVEWLGQVPETWDIMSVKTIATIDGGAGFPEDEQGYLDGPIPFYKVAHLIDNMSSVEHTITEETAKRLGAHIFPPGTLVFAKVGAALFLNRRSLLSKSACIDNNMMAIMPRRCDPKWLFWVFSNIDMGLVANPGAVPSVNQEQVGNIKLGLPSTHEQQAIAAYLDRETARIDALVDAKNRFIGLLREKRQALITHAVTKGLDPNVKMKDSGVEWLGQVPEHWEVKKIKHTTYLKGRVGWKGLKSDEYLDEGFAYLVTGTDFSAKLIDWGTCYHVSQERYDDDPFIQLKNGDLLITKDGTIGKLALVENLSGFACLNSGIFLVRPENSYTTNFLYWVLSSNIFSDFCNLNNSGSTIQHLYQNVFEDFAFPIPTGSEQNIIDKYLECETARIEALITKTERSIDLLKERRSALITAAVTGQIDLREVEE